MTTLAMLVLSACTAFSPCPPPAQTAPAPVLEARCSGCSCRGGPGFRDKNGKCVGWKALRQKCGNPPESRCIDERDGKRRGSNPLPSLAFESHKRLSYNNNPVSSPQNVVYEAFTSWENPFHVWHW